MKYKKIIGLDLGKKTGIAIAVEKMAIPSFVAKTADEVINYLIKEKPDLLIVGLPISLDGTLGKQCDRIKSILQTILKKTGPIPYEFQDERMSSKIYKNLPNEDALSAAWILQKFLNCENNG